MILRRNDYESGILRVLPNLESLSLLQEADIKGRAVLVRERRRMLWLGVRRRMPFSRIRFLCWSFLGSGDLGGGFLS